MQNRSSHKETNRFVVECCNLAHIDGCQIQCIAMRTLSFGYFKGYVGRAEVGLTMRSHFKVKQKLRLLKVRIEFNLWFLVHILLKDSAEHSFT